MLRLVEFLSDGTTLRGRLHLPQSEGPVPAVVMAHGFSATIDGMVVDRYAEVFAGSGMAVLLYDHRSFGISSGTPRQQVDPWRQARGYRDAIAYLTTVPAIDPERIAIWGDSMSGGEAIAVAAVDARVRALVAQVPACGDALPPDDEAPILDAMRAGITGDLPPVLPGTGPLPVVSSDQLGTPSHLTPLTAFRWFIEYGGRHGTNWENRATRVSRSAPWHPVVCASELSIPSLFVIAPEDEMPGCRPEISVLAYRRAQGAELLEVPGGHFGLLHHPGSAFELASRVERDFLALHLI